MIVESSIFKGILKVVCAVRQGPIREAARADVAHGTTLIPST